MLKNLQPVGDEKNIVSLPLLGCVPKRVPRVRGKKSHRAKKHNPTIDQCGK